MTLIDMTNKETAAKVVMLTLVSGLTIEVNTNGRVLVARAPNNTLATARRLGFKGRTRKQALEWAVEQMVELVPDYQPGWSTVEALNA